jgi:two-component system nitrate/nitrite sensor histidine kinase NarX
MEFQAKGGVTITLESSLPNYPLTPNEEIHVLQIVREALSNVLRHSGADKAWILLSLDAQEGCIEVRVTDDGSGPGTPDPGRSHYGLTIMRERAEILGGTIALRTATNGGAEVILRFTPEHAISPVAGGQAADDSARAVS